MAEHTLTPEMRRLIIAGRNVAYDQPTPTPPEFIELDQALEAFADQVPWDDQPEAPPNTKGWCPHCGCGNDTHGFAHLKSCASAVSSANDGCVS